MQIASHEAYHVLVNLYVFQIIMDPHLQVKMESLNEKLVNTQM